MFAVTPSIRIADIAPSFSSLVSHTRVVRISCHPSPDVKIFDNHQNLKQCIYTCQDHVPQVFVRISSHSFGHQHTLVAVSQPASQKDACLESVSSVPGTHARTGAWVARWAFGTIKSLVPGSKCTRLCRPERLPSPMSEQKRFVDIYSRTWRDLDHRPY